MSDDGFRSYDPSRGSRSLRTLREQTYRVAKRIGLQEAEATLNELNTAPPGPIEYLTEHLRLVGAWAEAVELLRFEQEVGA